MEINKKPKLTLTQAGILIFAIYLLVYLIA